MGRRHRGDRLPVAARSSTATARRRSCRTPSAGRRAGSTSACPTGACGIAWAPAGCSARSATRLPVAAVRATYGARWSPEYTDVVHSRLVILWGHNPASTAPHFMPMLREAQQRGAYVVVIDPRRTLTARSVDEHIRPRPATDGALALGLMHVLFTEGLHDEAWLEANTIGWRDLRDRAACLPAGQGRRDHRRPGGDDRRARAPARHDEAGAGQVRRRGAAPRQRRPDDAGDHLPASGRRPGRRARRRPVLLDRRLHRHGRRDDRARERVPADAARGQHEPDRRRPDRRGHRPADHVAVRLRLEPGRDRPEHRRWSCRASCARTCSPSCTSCS